MSEHNAFHIPTGVFTEAVREFWDTRARQGRAQEERGVTDQGLRSAVTGGKQMDGFLRTIMTLLESSRVTRDQIFVSRADTNLPGFFRPAKAWDIVVIRDNKLLAAVEMKSQVGPSFGNNFNNRTEEALGTAVDLWTAYREGLLGTTPQPFVGYLLVVEADPGSLTPIKIGAHHFTADPIFAEASYARRYEIFCRRLVLERQYTSACLLLTNPTRSMQSPNYDEPSEDINAQQFLSQLLRAVAL